MWEENVLIFNFISHYPIQISLVINKFSQAESVLPVTEILRDLSLFLSGYISFLLDFHSPAQLRRENYRAAW